MLEVFIILAFNPSNKLSYFLSQNVLVESCFLDYSVKDDHRVSYWIVASVLQVISVRFC